MAKNRCAFCPHEGELTNEHLWPKWLHKILPLEFKGTNHTHVVVKPPNVFSSEPSIIRNKRAGDPGSRKLRIACSTCNNGWMSQLQEKAKPHLEKIIRGGWSDLSTQVENLVKWCAMTSMVVEYVDPTTIATPQEERERLGLGSALSTNWHIWVGRCPLETPNRGFAHRAYRLVWHDTSPYGPPNCFATTLHVGELIFQVVYSPEIDEESCAVFGERYQMRMLFPNQSPLLDSKPEASSTNSSTVRQRELTDFFEG